MGGPSWLGLSVLISGTWTLEEQSLLSNPGRKRSWRLHRGPRGRQEWGDGEAACIEPLWSGGREGSQGAPLGQRTGPSCFPPFQGSPPTPHVAPLASRLSSASLPDPIMSSNGTEDRHSWCPQTEEPSALSQTFIFCLRRLPPPCLYLLSSIPHAGRRRQAEGSF